MHGLGSKLAGRLPSNPFTALPKVSRSRVSCHQVHLPELLRGLFWGRSVSQPRHQGIKLHLLWAFRNDRRYLRRGESFRSQWAKSLIGATVVIINRYKSGDLPTNRKISEKKRHKKLKGIRRGNGFTRSGSKWQLTWWTSRLDILGDHGLQWIWFRRNLATPK